MSGAELPHQITHPFHPSHPLTLHANYERQIFVCDSCHRWYYCTFRYRCEQCNFDMDEECALMEPITCEDNQPHIRHFTHQHPMPLLHLQEDYRCFACGSSCSGLTAYACMECDHFLHESCAELPHEIEHPSHPSHPLILQAIHQLQLHCRLCDKDIHLSMGYKCHQCRHWMCVKCSNVMTQAVKYKSHEHLLYFVEGMCTKIEKCKAYDSYCKKRSMSNSKEFDCTSSFLLRCMDCYDFNVHLLCGPLPSIVKHEWHIDPLILVNSVVEDDSDEFYCDVCETERDPKICYYYCKECKYAAHVHCVISEVINVLKGIREDHVKLKSVSEDVWKFPKEIQPNSTSEIEEEEEQGVSTMTFRDFINQLTDFEKRNLRYSYEWEETSSKKKGQVEDSSCQTSKLEDDKGVIRTVQLSRFTHQDFQHILFEFRDFYSRTKLELESEDLEIKIVMVQGYMIPQTLAPVLKTILHHHADVCSECHRRPGLKSFALFILCKVVKRMCSIMVKDITRDLLQQWYYHLQFVKYVDFKIDFARAHLESLVRAYMGLEAKRLEEDIPAKLKQKLVDLKREIIETESRLEKCKEYGGSSAKSEFMKECLNKASEWKYKKACELLFSDPQGNLPISNVWL